jgi:ATP-dependent exoDNAse (exonuclease V) alpha subunit
VAKLLYELEKKNVLTDLRHHARQIVRAARKKRTYKLQRLKLREGSVVILDESAFCSTQELARVEAAVTKRRATLLCLGDPRQLNHPTEHGCPHVLLEKMLEAARITKVTRQTDAADRNNVYRLSEGKAQAVFDDLKARGLLHVSATKEDTFRAVIRQWQDRGLADPGRHVIIAQTNAERDTLNQLARDTRKEHGFLRTKSIRLGPDRKQFYENDAVLFATPGGGDRKTMPALKHYGIVNGSTATLVKVDHRKNELTFKLTDDRCITLPAAKCAPALDHAYCLTVHRSQSKTYETACVALGGSMTHAQLAYTAASRAKGETHLFCEQDSVAELPNQMARGRAEHMAHDLLQLDQRQRQQTHSLTSTR